MKMRGPVFIGDTVTVVVEVLKKRTTKDVKKGVQTWTYRVKNQRQETVMSFDYTMMFHMRG
jgi:acyl dehydratase